MRNLLHIYKITTQKSKKNQQEERGKSSIDSDLEKQSISVVAKKHASNRR
jgi:hypothetical protein